MSLKSTGLFVAAVSALALANFAAYAYSSSNTQNQSGTTSSSSSSSSSAGRTTATKEQMDACNDKKEGDSCTFTSNFSSKTGTCQKASNGNMACQEAPGTGSTSGTTQ